MQIHAYICCLRVQVTKILFNNCRHSTMIAEHAKMKHIQSDLDAKTGEVNKLTQQIIKYI